VQLDGIRKTDTKSLSLVDQINCRMGATQMKEELHNYINQADERVLRLFYGMMKADNEEGDYSLTDTHKEILDERLAAHRSAPHEGSGWKEVKARITKKE
jgi:putative addiction module component (TIGR02574 family)